MNMQQVTARTGWIVTVDTDACIEFGYQHDEKVYVTPSYKKATVVGVGPMFEGSLENTLWIRMEGEDKVCFCPSPKDDLKKIN